MFPNTPAQLTLDDTCLFLHRMQKYSQYKKGHVGCILGPWQGPVKDQGGSWTQWGSTFASPKVPWSHFCCIECKNIANNYFHLGQAIKSGNYGGTLALKGRARVLSWSELAWLGLRTLNTKSFVPVSIYLKASYRKKCKNCSLRTRWFPSWM